MRSDELWELWLVQIRGGGDQSLLEELKEAKTLEFFGKTYMDAYIAATACKCADCGTWTGHLNLLVLRPTCGPCFTQWSRTNLMVKSKVCTNVYETTPRPGLILTPLPLSLQTTQMPSCSIISPAGSLTQSRPCPMPNWASKGHSPPSPSLFVPTPSVLLLSATRMVW